jgi:hypothetical protein
VPRRPSCRPRQGAPKSFLLAVARQQLVVARNGAAGRSCRSVGEGGGSLRHVVVALRAGEALGPDAPDGCTAWSAQILQGSVLLIVGRARRFGWPGDLVSGPTVAYELRAEQDSALLITTASASSAAAFAAAAFAAATSVADR